MSLQLVTDINPNPQTDSQSLKSDFTQTISAQKSFSEFVSFYKNPEISENMTQNEQNSGVQAQVYNTQSETEVQDERKLEKDEKYSKKENSIDNKKEVVKKSVEENEEDPNAASKVLGQSQVGITQDDNSSVNKKTQFVPDFMTDEVSKISQTDVEFNAENLLEQTELQKNLKKTKDFDFEMSDLSKEKFSNLVPEEALKVKNAKNELSSEKPKNLEQKTKGNAKNAQNIKNDKNVKITVDDQRSKTELVSPEKNEKSNLKNEIKFTNENTALMTVEVQNQSEANVLSLNTQTAASDGSNFQAMLNNQIQANVPDVVKAGSIILKDNDQGTINLVLHPDDLGNVKIHLNLDGKTISGHITVATKEAFEAFKNNAETLRDQFIKSGFEGADFDVSYSGNNSFAQGGNESQNQNSSQNLFARRAYDVSVNEANLDEILENSKEFDNFTINIVA